MSKRGVAWQEVKDLRKVAREGNEREFDTALRALFAKNWELGAFEAIISIGGGGHNAENPYSW